MFVQGTKRSAQSVCEDRSHDRHDGASLVHVTLYISAISPSVVSSESGIEKIRWISSKDSNSNVLTVAGAIKWLREGEGRAFVVAGADGPVAVQVVNANPPYLRTVPNDTTADNLLSLPRF